MCNLGASRILFLEHFEVFEEFRNQKFGEKILESLQEKFEKLILETEPDSLSEIAERRLRFMKEMVLAS